MNCIAGVEDLLNGEKLLKMSIISEPSKLNGDAADQEPDFALMMKILNKILHVSESHYIV